MARIRELQPAHHSDKVTVEEAARAFMRVRMRRLGLIDPTTSGDDHARNGEDGHAAKPGTEDDFPPASSNGGKP